MSRGKLNKEESSQKERSQSRDQDDLVIHNKATPLFKKTSKLFA
jgi:hypothetical protein